MKCQAAGCRCPIKARPIWTECHDGDKYLGVFCPCHTLDILLTTLEHDPEARIVPTNERIP